MHPTHGPRAGGLVLALVSAFGSIGYRASLAAYPAAISAGRQGAPASVAAADDPWNARWSISETIRDEKRVLVRRNATAAALVGDPRFAERVSVEVPLPRGADYTPATDLHHVETLLVDALERDRKAIGVLVLTTDATREFVFYTADAAGAADVVAGLRAKAAPFDLRCQTGRDPAWDLYASFAP